MANLLWKTLARVTAAFGLLAGSNAHAQGTMPMMLTPQAASAPMISPDNSGTIAQTTGVTSITQSFTVGSGSNRALIVEVYSSANSSAGFSGVTYAGSSMTVLGTIYQMGTLHPLTLLYLAAPASGANNLVLSGLDVSFNYQAAIVSYAGATQTTPANIVSDNTTFTTSLTLTLTTASNNSWLVGAFVNISADPLTAGTNTSIIQQSFGFGLTDTNAAMTPTGSYGLTVTGDNAIFGIAIELAP